MTYEKLIEAQTENILSIMKNMCKNSFMEGVFFTMKDGSADTDTLYKHFDEWYQKELERE